jgi:hypothetical protein
LRDAWPSLQGIGTPPPLSVPNSAAFDPTVAHEENLSLLARDQHFVALQLQLRLLPGLKLIEV